MNNIERNEEIEVKVTEVMYVPKLETPEDKPHPFVYFIEIHNHSARDIRLFGRKWIVQETSGELVVLEGDGIVGQNPRLNAGENYAYNSYHVTAMNARAGGAFYGQTTEGDIFFAEIPHFALEIPEWVKF